MWRQTTRTVCREEKVFEVFSAKSVCSTLRVYFLSCNEYVVEILAGISGKTKREGACLEDVCMDRRKSVLRELTAVSSQHLLPSIIMTKLPSDLHSDER